MYIDTHAHVNFNVFKDDADQVIRNALNEKVWMILVGTEYKTSKRALDYANRYETGVYAAIGLHPIHIFPVAAQGEDYDFTTRGEDFSYDVYEKLGQFEKTVAIGEIGLDYYHIEPSQDVNAVKEKQRQIFIEQLLLARHLELPVIIHCRQAHDDMTQILGDIKKEHKELFPKEKSWGVMHCFSGDENLAWKYFGFGLTISFTGIVTFSRQWDELIRKLPSDRFMVETDCPYMTPEPFRGQRNEPLYVKNIAGRIADIRKTTPEKIADITTNNAIKLFNL